VSYSLGSARELTCLNREEELSRRDREKLLRKRGRHQNKTNLFPIQGREDSEREEATCVNPGRGRRLQSLGCTGFASSKELLRGKKRVSHKKRKIMQKREEEPIRSRGARNYTFIPKGKTDQRKRNRALREGG